MKQSFERRDLSLNIHPIFPLQLAFQTVFSDSLIHQRPRQQHLIHDVNLSRCEFAGGYAQIVEEELLKCGIGERDHTVRLVFGLGTNEEIVVMRVSRKDLELVEKIRRPGEARFRRSPFTFGFVGRGEVSQATCCESFGITADGLVRRFALFPVFDLTFPGGVPNVRKMKEKRISKTYLEQ